MSIPLIPRSLFERFSKQLFICVAYLCRSLIFDRLTSNLVEVFILVIALASSLNKRIHNPVRGGGVHKFRLLEPQGIGNFGKVPLI